MQTGVVKFWDKSRGFGFVTPDHGNVQPFVHVNQLEGRMPAVGDAVEYLDAMGERGLYATTWRVLDDNNMRGN